MSEEDTERDLSPEDVEQADARTRQQAEGEVQARADGSPEPDGPDSALPPVQ